MISFMPIWAIVLRHMLLIPQNLNSFLTLFYWPLLDIIIWGFLGAWIQSSQTSPSLNNYEMTALLCILLWQVTSRGATTLCISLSEELWSYNTINLFSLPLKITHWIAGVILFYIIVIVITSIYCLLTIFTLYTLPVWETVRTFLLFFPSLLICGIWLGFTCLQIIILAGRRGTELAFALGWSLAPFTGAYYPVTALPSWGQKISSALPMSYLLQGMRNYLMFNQNPKPLLIKGTLLACAYAITSIIIFIYCFNYSKKAGLARLHD